MQSEQEIRQLKEELEKLTVFMGEHGTSEQLAGKDFRFSCNVCDALSWILDELSTERFRSDAYLNLERIKHIAKAIEIRTRKKLTNYK